MIVRSLLLYLFLILFSGGHSGFLLAQTAVPPLTSRVMDLSQSLSSREQATLTQLIIDFERSSSQGAQIAVLMLDSLAGEPLSHYTDRVFKQWQLGQKQSDNGLLIVVVKNDRQVRIEVGYGLEGALTDLQASKIIKQDFIPYFKQGDYFSGLQRGIQSMRQIIGPSEPDDVAPRSLEAAFPHLLLPYLAVLTSIFWVVLILSRFLPIPWLKRSSGRMNLGRGLLMALSNVVVMLSLTGSAGLTLRSTFMVFVISTVVYGVLSHLALVLGHSSQTEKRTNVRDSRAQGEANHQDSDSRGGFGGGGGSSGGGGASGSW